MPYPLFVADMRAVKNEAMQAAKRAGGVMKKHIQDPFKMFLPLCRQVAILGWCAVKATYYLLKQVFS